MIKPLFNQLDSNYETNSSRTHRCTVPFTETSAIRMCEALTATDSRFLNEFKKSAKAKCPHDYIKGARDLAEILSQPHVLGVRNHAWKAQPTDDAPKDIYGKQGIICFIDIPGYKGQGHIDLWDNNSIVGNDYWDAAEIWLWELI